MIPLKDNIPSRSFPLVTLLLIGLNTLAWLYELSLGPYMDDLILFFGVTPAQLFHMGLGSQLFVMTTAMFLHGSWMHFLGNMLYLWIFGDNVEDRMGKLRFLLFYLITGYLATLAHVISDPSSASPLIGASGAIAGVLGGYFILYPYARVLTLIPIFIFIQIIRIPAFYFLGFWFLLQILNQAFSLPGTQSVAFLAHIAGFAAGALLVKRFQKTYRY
ncbi:rhomboid family intramembrane serine protease [Desulforamulus hydrothermalis]|uniref:Rhomboid family protein n=1 Tax=Desulforamulus hydrothermalis Lam5 = DSM 18033 TaxID=1121428 RepID=K8DYR7_9FIRM|nr:rhomboid family intramembrane serine protease [Desulforamulus hydrothermalis]CCO08092.1 Rhomboid family protein [Desulforamulus hydrothermalis Lam5 = DSM 18033]SHG82196.1 Membrane associated serine protease, rhomboid family [Desulforamulus hydrothermalis Lam5 = DSM 18033]